MKLDRKTCEAVSQLEPSPAFRHLIESIREDTAEALRQCGATDGNAIYRAQGKYAALQGLLDDLSNARAVLASGNFQR